MVLDIEFSYLWGGKYAWRVKYIDKGVLNNDFKDFELHIYVSKYTFFSNEMLSLGYYSDENVNVCNEYEKTLIENKVKLVNQKYKKNKIERCKEGEIYWYIDTGFGEYPFNLQYSKENYNDGDTKLFGLRNYFKTKEEAQEKLDNLIKCFYED